MIDPRENGLCSNRSLCSHVAIVSCIARRVLSCDTYDSRNGLPPFETHASMARERLLNYYASIRRGILDRPGALRMYIVPDI